MHNLWFFYNFLVDKTKKNCSNKYYKPNPCKVNGIAECKENLCRITTAANRDVALVAGHQGFHTVMVKPIYDLVMRMVVKRAKRDYPVIGSEEFQKVAAGTVARAMVADLQPDCGLLCPVAAEEFLGGWRFHKCGFCRVACVTRDYKDLVGILYCDDGRTFIFVAALVYTHGMKLDNARNNVTLCHVFVVDYFPDAKVLCHLGKTSHVVLVRVGYNKVIDTLFLWLYALLQICFDAGIVHFRACVDYGHFAVGKLHNGTVSVPDIDEMDAEVSLGVDIGVALAEIKPPKRGTKGAEHREKPA